MVNEILSWLRTCPLIDKNDRFCVNYLGAEPVSFCLEETPGTPIVTRYMDGSSIREKAFVLSATQDYSPDTLSQIANSGFWEELADWVEAQNHARNFPAMRAGRTARKIEITTTHYLFGATENTARYQVQMKLTYYQKGARS